MCSTGLIVIGVSKSLSELRSALANRLWLYIEWANFYLLLMGNFSNNIFTVLFFTRESVIVVLFPVITHCVWYVLPAVVSMEYICQWGVWSIPLANVYVSKEHGISLVTGFVKWRIWFISLVGDCTSEEHEFSLEQELLVKNIIYIYFSVFMPVEGMVEIKY